MSSISNPETQTVSERLDQDQLRQAATQSKQILDKLHEELALRVTEARTASKKLIGEMPKHFTAQYVCFAAGNPGRIIDGLDEFIFDVFEGFIIWLGDSYDKCFGGLPAGFMCDTVKAHSAKLVELCTAQLDSLRLTIMNYYREMEKRLGEHSDLALRTIQPPFCILFREPMRKLGEEHEKFLTRLLDGFEKRVRDFEEIAGAMAELQQLQFPLRQEPDS
ncbi:hypothetical protein BJX64DRAFT_286899 [Aspergillus heterothallicus]